MIHVTNWSSRKLHGPGRRLTIMAAPRAWEHGDGSVPLFVPHLADLADVKAGRMTVDIYRELFEDTVANRLSDTLSDYGTLKSPFVNDSGAGFLRLLPNDTLLCACSRAKAAVGECHRVWTAHLLRQAGWEVCLDGEVLPCPPPSDDR